MRSNKQMRDRKSDPMSQLAKAGATKKNLLEDGTNKSDIRLRDYEANLCNKLYRGLKCTRPNN